MDAYCVWFQKQIKSAPILKGLPVKWGSELRKPAITMWCDVYMPKRTPFLKDLYPMGIHSLHNSSADRKLTVFLHSLIYVSIMIQQCCIAARMCVRHCARR